LRRSFRAPLASPRRAIRRALYPRLTSGSWPPGWRAAWIARFSALREEEEEEEEEVEAGAPAPRSTPAGGGDDLGPAGPEPGPVREPSGPSAIADARGERPPSRSRDALPTADPGPADAARRERAAPGRGGARVDPDAAAGASAADADAIARGERTPPPPPLPASREMPSDARWGLSTPNAPSRRTVSEHPRVRRTWCGGRGRAV